MGAHERLSVDVLQPFQGALRGGGQFVYGLVVRLVIPTEVTQLCPLREIGLRGVVVLGHALALELVEVVGQQGNEFGLQI